MRAADELLARRRLALRLFGRGFGARRGYQQRARRGRRCRASRAEAPFGGVPRCALLKHPDETKTEPKTKTGLRIYVSMIDEQLDEKGRIVPGLGDAGDRAFGGI